MEDIEHEDLIHDPIHGYIPFICNVPAGELPEAALIDHPWLQRLRQIHQLQTAWWVYPSAEHTRFQHVVGAMHLASRAVARLYDSLALHCEETPSRAYVECTARVAALLHDVGHGPFGHFFDEHFLKDFGLTHETLGAHIIENELGDLIRQIRRCPEAFLPDHEELDPAQVAFLIQRPRQNVASNAQQPRWLVQLRSLFCGIYTVDNMDFVLRDAYMTGYSSRAFDIDRLLRYSIFRNEGLTLHQRGINALVRFMAAKSELFRAVYFHRVVRAIDKTLEGLFRDSKQLLFVGNPLDNLSAYQHFTEWSLLIDVASWKESDHAEKRRLAPRWQKLLKRDLDWETAAERYVVHSDSRSEAESWLNNAARVKSELESKVPALRDLDLEVDVARHLHRPHAKSASAGQNFMLVPGDPTVRPISDDELIRQLPVSHRICRVYVGKSTPPDIRAAIAAALNAPLEYASADDLTNM